MRRASVRACVCVRVYANVEQHCELRDCLISTFQLREFTTTVPLMIENAVCGVVAYTVNHSISGDQESEKFDKRACYCFVALKATSNRGPAGVRENSFYQHFFAGHPVTGRGQQRVV